MHPEVTGREPGSCPKCGMKLIPAAPPHRLRVPDAPGGDGQRAGNVPQVRHEALPAAPPITYVCPMHPEVTGSEPGTCPKCGMKLIPSDTPAPPAHDAQQHHHGHDSGDGLEWEDLMPEINARTDASNMIWRLVDQETGADAPPASPGCATSPTHSAHRSNSEPSSSPPPRRTCPTTPRMTVTRRSAVLRQRVSRGGLTLQAQRRAAMYQPCTTS